MPPHSTTLWIPLAVAMVVAALAYAAVRVAAWIVRHQTGERRLARKLFALPLLKTLRHRMTALEYLGLHLAAGALVCFGGLVVFMHVLLAVLGRQDLTYFDRDMARVLYRAATPWGVELWGFVSHLGTYKVMGTIGGVLSLLLWRRGMKLFLPVFVIGIWGASFLNSWLKVLVRRARPFWEEPLAAETSFSFPSGHSMGSIVGYGLIAYAVYLLTRKRKIWMPTAVGLFIVVLGIGYSRMYLGVHFFTDVVGGFALGAFWLAACVTGIAVAERLQFRNGKQAR